jgi:ATPase subunit of ABC transporter with duplicated ATPase domains
VLKDISLGFYYGAKIGVLGLNGSGKSTLLGIIAGRDQGYSGEIAVSKGYSIGLLEQDPQLDPAQTVIAIVREGALPVVDLLARYDAVCDKLGDGGADMDALLAEQARLLEEIEKHDAWNLDNHLEIAMEALRCPPAETPVAVLSGGERRRVALTRLLLMEPDILLLDEPTNHLDVYTREALEEAIEQFSGTLVVVSHDRYFVDRVAQQIIAVEEGEAEIFQGNYSEVRRRIAEQEAAAAVPAPQAAKAVKVTRAPKAANPAPAATQQPKAQTDRQEQRVRDRRARKLDEEIAQVEKLIASLESEKEKHDLALCSEEVYRDGERTRTVQAELAEIRKQLDALYTRWDRVSAERGEV